MAGGAVAYVHFTPKKVNCAAGRESESGDPDAGPGALQKGHGNSHAIAEKDSFALARYKAGRRAAKPWNRCPELNSIMGDRGAVLSNWLVRGCLFLGPPHAVRAVFYARPNTALQRGVWRKL